MLRLATAVVLVSTLVVPSAHPMDDDDDGGPAAPADYSYVQKTVPGQTLPRHAYDIAAAQARHLPKVGGAWQSLGPTNIGGRVVGLAMDPTTTDALYAASASGGLWRSTDAGRTFTAAWPQDSTQAMGAVAVAPNGTVYVGTGEPNPGGGSVTYEGTGVYRSTDHGANWQQVGLPDSGTIGAIAIDPTNPQRILVAANGSLYNAGGDRGVYLSSDAGSTWHKVLDVPNAFTGAVDVQFDPADPHRVYAALWDHRRQPDQRVYGGVGSGLYRSTDSGATWQQLGGGLPATGPDVGRYGFGISASQPGRMYAIVGTTAGSYGSAYTSADAGATWTRLPDDAELVDSQSSYSWWFGKIWVDPTDANHVQLAGVPLVTSHDGGKTWTADDAVHSDQHVIVWDPRHPKRVYLGNDGGVYRSDSNGDGGWTHATVEPFTQLYSVAITAADTSRVSGGAQDNGSLRSWGGTRFNEYFGGDGQENLISPANDNIVFACLQYGECARSTNGGSSMTDFTGATTADRRNWLTPVQFDPTNPKVMYYGGNRLNRSTDGGVTWTAISPDLTGGPGKDDFPFGTITTVAAATDQHTVWVGTDDGRVWVTHNLGATWTNVLTGQPWVTRVVPDPQSPNSAYVTLSGYRSGSAQPHVLRTTDSGGHWTDLSGNLPQAPVNTLVIGAGGILYAGTDQGVFTGTAGSAQWARLGQNLPLVPVDDIAYDPSHHRLVIATFGRGFYSLTVA
ncbi:glycosyl hydrolase [Kutzneria buriramensis]|uniref:Sortilin (Neurotensin receptor 3) n=1 Tax=Kutzneria buriramensis TaxID=1045776 RepID=A0A3E0H887_9PSEU|nr:glycosyl hydrolase [Kutzneria buriramensis]REH39497.1 sortilin (neurotensin receptor 3) [Kutzneria buriramensis]